MPHFGERSQRNLVGVHPGLIELFAEVVKGYDCTIISGFRTESEQTALLEHDPPRTQLAWPGSKHNSIPSFAVDVAPYPIDWSDIQRFIHFAGYVQRVSEELMIAVRWGGFWKRFPDYSHWEIAS